MGTFAVLTIGIISGVIACAINVYKYRSGVGGFLIGFFLSIVGIIIVLGRRPKLPPEMPRVGPAALPPPGWYPDPRSPNQQRFWNGQRWSDPPQSSADRAQVS
ncbi:DUF2510 domain-containing protein [Mycobacterium colombiense]